MFRFPSRLIPLTLLLGASGFPVHGQIPAEPGLEKAVGWIWRVEPSDTRVWGLPLPVAPPPPPVDPTAFPPPGPGTQAGEYVIQRGDALIRIARKFDITVEQLKLYNGLTNNIIRAGDTLKIPTRIEAERLAPTPPPPVPRRRSGEKVDPMAVSAQELQTAAVQAFLDRQQFSSGPIDGKMKPEFGKVLYLFQSTRPELADPAVLEARVRETVGDGFTTYTLTPEDYRFIAPPAAGKVEAAEPAPEPKASPEKSTTNRPVAERARQSYDDLTKPAMLAYSTPWEFVAERFHCDEAFLRKLNAQIRTVPTAGTEFRVPNVDPFAIEDAFSAPLQPKPDPRSPVTAAVLDQAFLQIFQEESLVAVMPLSMARPGLRGRGSWVILNAIPRPRLATRQEDREKPVRQAPLFGQPSSEPTPTPGPRLVADQYLAPGPNNPVGIIWINLAKSDDPTPLPFGLHGTSTPDQMQALQSLGGIRLTNWDILRATHLLPPGTPLEWRQSGTAAAPPAAAPAP